MWGHRLGQRVDRAELGEDEAARVAAASGRVDPARCTGPPSWDPGSLGELFGWPLNYILNRVTEERSWGAWPGPRVREEVQFQLTLDQRFWLGKETKDIGGDAGGGTAGKPGPRTSRTGPPSGATSRPPAAQRMRTLLPQRCGYTILHLLGQLRPPDARSSSHSGREVVMRVTTV